MVEDLGSVTLKSSEVVRAAAIRGPDPEWRDRIARLLLHKGDPWNWQNSELLTRDTGLAAWFYVLHRAGAPFAHIMTAECNGVGILGHVWTEPTDRGLGGAAALMTLQMAHFRSRRGRALFLNAAPGSPAFRLYERHGFRAIEEGSGTMRFGGDCAESFAPAPVRIEPVNWSHWPLLPALITAAIPGIVRCHPLNLLGRKSPEEELLPHLRAAARPPQVLAAVAPSGAVVGLAAWNQPAHLPGAIVADVFCHSNFWPHSDALLAALLASAPSARTIAFADSTCPEKSGCLGRAGFRLAATEPRALALNAAATDFADQLRFECAAPASCASS